MEKNVILLSVFFFTQTTSIGGGHAIGIHCNSYRYEELIANAKSTAANKKCIVLLAHNIVGSTTECLEDLIEQFQDYRIEPLTPEVKPVQFREKTS